MTTDNTTLADVQPGGRVRLDKVRDRVMGECEQWFDTSDVDMEAATDSIIAAAQPSPGGQDALAALQQDYDKLLDSFDRQVEVAEKIAGRVLQQDDRIEELEEALAARQPVGEPAAWMHTHKATGRVKFGLSPMYDCDFNAVQWDSVALYAAPAQAVDLGQSVGMAELDQILLDPENQPSQFGTVPTELLEKCEEMISDLVHQFGDRGCTCTFPEADCCAYARAEHYSRDGAAHG